jgi:hypothetical protein
MIMIRRVLLVLALLAIPVGPLAVRTSAADEGGIHGCWFFPPDPPGCDYCGYACNPGQKCCIKIVLPG